MGEVCPGPPICEPTIAICDSIGTHFIYNYIYVCVRNYIYYTHFVSCPGSQLLYGCSQHLVTVLIILYAYCIFCMCSFSVCQSAETRTELAHAVQSSPVAWINRPTCGCHADPVLMHYRSNCFAVKPHCM